MHPEQQWIWSGPGSGGRPRGDQLPFTAPEECSNDAFGPRGVRVICLVEDWLHWLEFQTSAVRDVCWKEIQVCDFLKGTCQQYDSMSLH